MAPPALKNFHSATQAFANGQDTPRDYLERCIEIIQKHEPQVGAFVHLNIEGARKAADRSSARWKNGQPLSPIDGMPIGIKDIIETIDMPTEMGSPLYKGWRSDRDAASVAALREAGAVIIGKTVTTEFAAMAPRGTRNPWDLQRTPGGSSSGSAASVGGGFLPAGIGTQALGSIVRPASYCGCVGFKPTAGAVNRGGSLDYLSHSCTGVLAASLEDAWNVIYAITSRVGGDPGRRGFIGPKQRPAAKAPRAVAILETAGWELASPSAKNQLAASIDRMRTSGVEIIDRRNNKAVEEAEIALVNAVALCGVVNSWEWRWPLNTYHERDPKALGQFLLDRLAQAKTMTLDDYRAGIDERARVRAVYGKLAAHCGAIITLSATGAAPMGLEATGNAIFNAPASLLGVPALSLPLFEDEGLPVGLQVMGFEDGDAEMFGVAAWVQNLLGAKKPA